MLRANSRLRQFLGQSGVDFVQHSTNAIQRILPHVQASAWNEANWSAPDSVWTSSQRTKIRMTLAIGGKEDPQSRSLAATIERRHVPVVSGSAKRTFDTREYDVCKKIALRISEVAKPTSASTNSASIQAIRDAFDEYVVASSH